MQPDQHDIIDHPVRKLEGRRNKWRRATLSQVQLSSYFTGYTEIYALREELKKKQGKDFNLKNFNEKFLSYGSAPVKYIRQMMLR